eukprot:CAMPEP_0197234014 /NCGR_PEP_ID=MMETSP1429-20130617/1884_1 /TAXON_ID=49237 /ORGANISM="Chaetoceros  sp., Strain UNC1202" /LENGTH=294 /DNA_ID=CAMNT_0042692339 /DNA_START=24 /DNA_END=908 /DNA_ORIENTATION=+
MKLCIIPNYITIAFSLIGILNLVPTQGFLIAGPDLPAINPFLADFARDHAKKGIKLNIRLDILEDVYDAKSSHLYIKDLILELNNKEPNDDKFAVLPLPMTPSSSPSTSQGMARTGPFALQTHTNGSYVSSKGCQTLMLQHGCWEMLWLEENPAGSIICAFDISEDVSRNNAVLKAGGVYISFPVFTKRGLIAMRAGQNQHQSKLKLQIATEKEELEKVNATNNPFKKMVHFRKAVVANDEFIKLRSLGHTEVPMRDEEFMEVGDDLMVYSKGSVWSQQENCDTTFVGKASLKM